LNSPVPKNKQQFIFATTEEAKRHNAEILCKFEFNISQAILAQPNSLISFGSEFRHPMDLEPLLADHPLWADFKQILLHGATFPLRPISTEEPSIYLHFHSTRGNHKSADKLGEALKKLIESDVSHGFALPLPRELLFSIPNASLAPSGCVDQDTINERGERSKKFSMTHDHLFWVPLFILLMRESLKKISHIVYIASPS